ncbi:type VII secretion protein EccB [Streptomyces sp. HNM0575]|uniref:type VII secretion protein EccB n=1 Tax=Streptomyces sp. HNM0575 TaxID=2716338 RepID=UPI00145F36CB|nr:type VII secretion protein EccB [Streptomyces sp. HNM0575]NLU76532.1 type VII secretion protein EccB [Streptomyces sp. HNM0575]
MATRRDELSAHTFARKRTLAAFLQPESRVSDEEAPRPVRAMMPSMVVGLVLVAGAVAWGAIAPSAPHGWSTVGEHIIVDSDSTTRYVVLKERDKNGKKVPQLHPVLNFASAKLVLDKGKGQVIEVSGKDIDESTVARGSTIGIPYAPDRLPSTADAESPKEWAVCEKPGSHARGEPQQGMFVLGGQDKNKLKDKNRLGDGEAMFVEDSKTGDQYMVDGTGTKMLLHDRMRENAKFLKERSLLTRLAIKNPGDPQKVSSQWLETLNTGDPLTFPYLGGAGAGSPASFSGADQLPPEGREVGKVLRSRAGNTSYYYVVMKDKVQRTTPLVGKLAMGGAGLGQQKPITVNELQMANAGASENTATGGKGWPRDIMNQVNRPAEGIGSTSRTVSCSVYTGKTSGGKPQLAAWAGPRYPANIVDGAASAYVSSGSGLLYQEVTGSGSRSGTQYLLTDSGLRYALPKGGGDSQQGSGSSEKSPTARLGYEKAKVAPVPRSWSSLLPKGPTLDTRSASQEQGL